MFIWTQLLYWSTFILYFLCCEILCEGPWQFFYSPVCVFLLGNEEDPQSLFEVFRMEAETQPWLQALAVPGADYITQHPTLWAQHPACREPREYWWEFPGRDTRGERRQWLTHTQSHVFMFCSIHIHNYTSIFDSTCEHSEYACGNIHTYTYLHICNSIWRHANRHSCTQAQVHTCPNPRHTCLHNVWIHIQTCNTDIPTHPLWTVK